MGQDPVARAAAAARLRPAAAAPAALGLPRRGDGRPRRGEPGDGDVDLRPRTAGDDHREHRAPTGPGGVPHAQAATGRYRAWRTSGAAARRSEEHTSELQSLMRISYAVFCLKKKNTL